jgi:hypothetical protein
VRTSRTRIAALTSLLAAGVAIGVLAASGLAAGLVKHRFTAPLQGGVNNAGLELNAFYKNRVPSYVTDLTWENVSCGGPFAGVQHWKVGVNDKLKFSKKHAVQNGATGETVKITGKFTKKRGKYHLAGTFAVSPTSGCPNGTGTLTYKSG